MASGGNDKKKVAFITGINGQDGSYLAELLLKKGYIVHGTIRRASYFNTGRIEHLSQNPHAHTGSLLKLHYADLTDSISLVHLISEIKPDEVYNLAAQSHVKVSFEVPEYTVDADAVGTLRVLEAIRMAGITDTCRFYQASTSELYGLVQEKPQRETTPFYPRSPYGCAKLYGFWITKHYREAYNMWSVNGILFNHESPRRGENFVTRKITRAVAKISLGLQNCLELGNLDAMRDWGHARDFVEAMWMMLNSTDKPDDFVIATGETHSVREFCTASFKHVGIDIEWEGKGLNEIGIDKKSGKTLVCVNPKFFRPAEVDFLLGDATKAKNTLKWQPTTTFKELVTEMMDADLQLMKKNPDA